MSAPDITSRVMQRINDDHQKEFRRLIEAAHANRDSAEHWRALANFSISMNGDLLRLVRALTDGVKDEIAEAIAEELGPRSLGRIH